jgi:hypothetical protein
LLAVQVKFHNVDSGLFHTHPVCFTSAFSSQSIRNNTALYQKNSSNAVLPAVSQAASSEYVHQLDILLFSVQLIVKVLGLNAGRTLVVQTYTSFTGVVHT